MTVAFEAPAIDETLKARLEAAFGATEIFSQSTFRFADLPVVHVPPVAAIGPGGDAQTQALAEALATVLYGQCYARDYRGGGGNAGVAASGATDPAFAARVAAANATQTRWDPNWEVYQLGFDGAVHVRKGDSFLVALPGRFAFAQAMMRAPVAGDVVELLATRDSAVMQPGFYFIFGDTIASEYDDIEIARVYFNAAPECVEQIVGALSAKLNRYAIPFRLKFLTDPAWYDRTDAVVLYVARRFLEPVLSVVATARGAFTDGLRPEVPLFAKALAAGIGGADDPGSGESFGQARCRLTARGIVDAWLHGSQATSHRLDAVAQRFASAGLSLERPHVAAGFADLYALPVRWGC
ncbi:MAG TPA: T3SS effector HopA1 family protein [Candidatus Elarobacter sp.]|nr:T3SS effector HopA1 family protein [Candidatus Elarobacter sp.]